MYSNEKKAMGNHFPGVMHLESEEVIGYRNAPAFKNTIYN